MATFIRNLYGLEAEQAIAVLNQLRLDMMKNRAGLVFHADASSAVTTADATDLATSVALANALKTAYAPHIASACDATTGQGVHMAADATNTIVAANATDLATGITLGNELKAKYNAHRVLATAHHVTDTTNVVTSANAADQATLNTLLNEIKVRVNAHFAAAFNSQAIALVPA